ncbi:hypothetical protein [Flavobacterium sp. DG2-3]|nr:hypothetical protein [Flavobacterium sp. DG2-3]MDP5200345.1 hypothetical protein [Flavobacterium sp. DG2-3]
MENTAENYDDIQKCPYHSALKAQGYQNPPEKSSNKDADANTGDWDDQRDGSAADDSIYDTGRNDNSGGAGST